MSGSDREPVAGRPSRLRKPAPRSPPTPVSEGEGHVPGRTVQHQGRSQQGVAGHAVEGGEVRLRRATGAGSRLASRWSPQSRARPPPRSRCHPLDCSPLDVDRAVRQELHGERRGNRPYAWKIDQRPDERLHAAHPCAADSIPSQLPAGSAGIPPRHPGRSAAAAPARRPRVLVSSRLVLSVRCHRAQSSSALHHAWVDSVGPAPAVSPHRTVDLARRNLQTPAAHSSWPTGWIGRSSPKSWPTRSGQPTMAAGPVPAHARSSRATVSRGNTA